MICNEFYGKSEHAGLGGVLLFLCIAEIKQLINNAIFLRLYKQKLSLFYVFCMPDGVRGMIFQSFFFKKMKWIKNNTL